VCCPRRLAPSRLGKRALHLGSTRILEQETNNVAGAVTIRAENMSYRDEANVDSFMTFENLTSVLLEDHVLLDDTTCPLVGCYRRFGEV